MLAREDEGPDGVKNANLQAKCRFVHAVTADCTALTNKSPMKGLCSLTPYVSKKGSLQPWNTAGLGEISTECGT